MGLVPWQSLWCLDGSPQVHMLGDNPTSIYRRRLKTHACPMITFFMLVQYFNFINPIIFIHCSTIPIQIGAHNHQNSQRPGPHKTQKLTKPLFHLEKCHTIFTQHRQILERSPRQNASRFERM